MWLSVEVEVLGNGKVKETGEKQITLEFSTLPLDASDGILAVPLQVVPRQELNPVLMWVRYKDLSNKLRQEVGAARRKRNGKLCLRVRVLTTPVFQLCSIVHDKGTARFFPSKEAAEA